MVTFIFQVYFKLSIMFKSKTGCVFLPHLIYCYSTFYGVLVSFCMTKKHLVFCSLGLDWKLYTAIIAGSVGGLLFSLILMVIMICCWCIRRSRRKCKCFDVYSCIHCFTLDTKIIKVTWTNNLTADLCVCTGKGIQLIL